MWCVMLFITVQTVLHTIKNNINIMTILNINASLQNCQLLFFK